jgi:hypothetical protein
MKVKSNNNRGNKQDLEYLILKNFITVLKKNGMYPMFRCLVGTETKNVVTSIYKRMHSFEKFYKNQSKENVFRKAGNIDTFVGMMKEVAHGGVGTNYKTDDPAQLQGLIANTINMLLHVFIERNVRDIHTLESLGGQIFDMTCREVFGGEFEDMLPQPTPEMEKIRQMYEMMSVRGMRPTPEMIEEINRTIAEGRLPQFPGAPAPGQPMVNEEDWDFLDEFLGDEDNEEDGEFYDEEDEDFNADEVEEEQEEVIDWADDDWR